MRKALMAIGLASAIAGCGQSVGVGNNATVVDLNGVGTAVDNMATLPSLAPDNSANVAIPMGSTTGLLSRLPIRLGYYVAKTDRCEDALFTYKIEPDAIWTLVKPGTQDATSSKATFAGVEKRDAQKYFLKFPPEQTTDPVDPKGELVTVYDQEHLNLSVQDDVDVRYCAPETIPAGVKAQAN